MVHKAVDINLLCMIDALGGSPLDLYTLLKRAVDNSRPQHRIGDETRKRRTLVTAVTLFASRTRVILTMPHV